MASHRSDTDDWLATEAGRRVAKNVVGAYGEQGQRWLQGLAADLQSTMQAWRLRIQGEFRSSYGRVLGVTQGHRRLVLKLRVPHPEADHEVHSLGALVPLTPQIESVAPSVGAVLMERIEPGDEVNLCRSDDESTRVIAALVDKGWERGPPSSLERERLPTLAAWMKNLECLDGTHFAPTAHRARALFEQLDDDGPTRLLHGDLHQQNVLRSEMGWKVIDPQGVLGDPLAEVGAMLRNPTHGLSEADFSKASLGRRLDVLAERLAGRPGASRDRMQAWGFVINVLSAAWLHDSGEDASEAIEFATLLGQA